MGNIKEFHLGPFLENMHFKPISNEVSWEVSGEIDRYPTQGFLRSFLSKLHTLLEKVSA